MSAAAWARAVSRRDLAAHPGLLDTEPLRVVPAYRELVQRVVDRDLAARGVNRASGTPGRSGCAVYSAVVGGALVYALYGARDPFGPGAAWVLSLGGLVLAGGMAGIVLPLRRDAPLALGLVLRLAVVDLLAAVGLGRATTLGVGPRSPWWVLALVGLVVAIGLTTAALAVRARATTAQREEADRAQEQRAADRVRRTTEISARTRGRLQQAWTDLDSGDRELLTRERRAAFVILHERGLLDDVDAALASIPGLRLWEEREASSG